LFAAAAALFGLVNGIAAAALLVELQNIDGK
jgi:hypothetical protein